MGCREQCPQICCQRPSNRSMGFQLIALCHVICWGKTLLLSRLFGLWGMTEGKSITFRHQGEVSATREVVGPRPRPAESMRAIR